MNFIGKIVSLLLALSLLVFAGLAAFVHFYLTDEKVKNLVIPQAEKALGRSVSIGVIDVGVFSGISIHDFAVKEKDGQTDFMKTGKFIVSYDLLPLLQKKIVVSELLLDSPSVNIIRNLDGTLNFNTIAFLEKAAQKTDTTEKAPSTAAKTAIPIALTVDSIKVVNATLSFTDLKKELPKSEATANLTVGLDIGTDLADIKFNGKMDLSTSAKYDEAAFLAKITSSFTQNELSYNVDLDIDNEKLTVEGQVSQFQTPDIVVNISSQKLNLDRLMALAGILPKPEEGTDANTKKKASAPAKTDQQAIASSLPKGLHVHGLVSIKQAIYKKLPINNFQLEHDLSDGLLTIKDLSAQAAGGSLMSNMKVDLNKLDPKYNGNVSVNSMEISSLGTGLNQGFADIISGALQSSLNFDGQGFSPETIKKTLSADASYSLSNGQIKNTEVTKTIAKFTGVQELQELSFSDMAGTVKLLKGGIIELVSSITGTNFNAESKGTVDLDGQMNLPIRLTLSEAMSKKLDSKGAVSKFLANDKGETELRFKVAGLINSPKTSLDSAAVQDQLKNTLKSKAMNELDRLMMKQQGSSNTPTGDGQTETPTSKNPTMNILKGFLGQ